MLRGAPAIQPFQAEKVAPKPALPYISCPRWRRGDPWPGAPQLLFPQPFTCGVTGCTAQHLLEEEAAGKAVCVAGQLWGGSAGLSSRHSSAVHAPRSRTSNGKRLLPVTVNQIGEIRGLFA